MNYKPTNPYFHQNKLGTSNISRNQAFTPTRNMYNDSQMNTHHFGQLEQILDKQRKKFKEVKQKMENELDSQRKTRIQFENKLIKLKDEFSKKDISLSQLEFKINNLLHQNQDLLLENDRLKNQLGRMQEIYGNKIYQLQNQLTTQSKNFQQTTFQYNFEFEKFKKEGQEYIETLTFQFQRKIKNLEEKTKQHESARKELTLENKKINDILISNKLSFEQELRDQANRIRQQQLKKSQFLTKSFQQKIKGYEQNKDMLNRKIQELMRALQQKQRELQNFENQKNQQISKLDQQISDLNGRISHLTFLLDKTKHDLAEKDAIINRNNNQLNQEYNYLKQQLELKKKQVESLNQGIRQLRQTNKDIVADNERKRSELIQKCNYYESESRKYKDQYTKICETLKSKINQTITHVSYKRS